MFDLEKNIVRDSSLSFDDTAKVKFSLTALGYYDDSNTGLSPYADDSLFIAINDFQNDNGLKSDGIINQKGETQRVIKKSLQERPDAKSAFSAFWKNYKNMRKSNTIGADKYFHCRANYEASEKGWGGFAVAAFLSNMREATDIVKGTFKSGPIETAKDVIKDQSVNKYGRDAARTGNFKSSQEACSIFRPKALDEKY